MSKTNAKNCLIIKQVDLDSLRADYVAAPWNICNVFDDINDAT